MSRTRLEVLETSLAKKKTRLDERFKTHFADVASANGQPMNDKRNGAATMKRWDRQGDAIHNLKESIKITEQAIERERIKVENVTEVSSTLPQLILNMLESGELTQWRRHPTFFFVKGVKRARIVFKDDKVWHRYADEIATEKETDIFYDTYRKLSEEINLK